MNIIATGLENRIFDDVRAHGKAVAMTPLGTGSVELSLPDGPDGTVEGRARGEWLRVMQTLSGTALGVTDALWLNAKLPVTTRCVLGDGAGSLMLCSDLWLPSPVPLTTALEDLSTAFAAAATQIKEWNGASARTTPAAAPEHDVDGVRAAIDEGRWSVTASEVGLAVKLPVVTTEPATAIARAGSPRGYALETALPTVDGAETTGAVGRFLLALTARTRAVKASAVGTAEDCSFRLSVGVGPEPSARDVDTALMALAVTWNHSAREVLALNDSRVADTYRAATSTA